MRDYRDIRPIKIIVQVRAGAELYDVTREVIKMCLEQEADIVYTFNETERICQFVELIEAAQIKLSDLIIKQPKT